MPILFLGFKFSSFIFSLLFAGALMLASYEILALSWLASWFLSINVLTFLLMGKDKAASKAGKGRTPESTLLLMAFIGGFPGLFAGRKIFHHKTSKTGFVAPMWILFFLQIGLAAYFFGNITSLEDMFSLIGVHKETPQTP